MEYPSDILWCSAGVACMLRLKHLMRQQPHKDIPVRSYQPSAEYAVNTADVAALGLTPTFLPHVQCGPEVCMHYMPALFSGCTMSVKPLAHEPLYLLLPPVGNEPLLPAYPCLTDGEAACPHGHPSASRLVGACTPCPAARPHTQPIQFMPSAGEESQVHV